jgi:hypothetical protein
VKRVLKAILKTASNFLDNSDRVAQDARSRVAAGVDQVTSGASDIRDQAQHFYSSEDHTLRHIVTFAVGVGMGLGVGLLFAPASGEAVRDSLEQGIRRAGQRVRSGFSTQETWVPSEAEESGSMARPATLSKQITL